MKENQPLFGDVFKGRRVLVTGHTGFKGSWLAWWLGYLGARVTGVSIDVPTQPAHFDETRLSQSPHLDDVRLDVRDAEALRDIVRDVAPDFVFHLAAQALVKASFRDPLRTFSTNVMGSANLLQAVIEADQPCAVVMITSDKCYDNVEWIWGYRESDRLGGKDPYSASKGAAELAIRSLVNGCGTQIRVAVGRAGNVIGGGDWAMDRIVPDCMKSWAMSREVEIRRPEATRPWQHVLEPLSGYLALARSLDTSPALHGEAFNFGPASESVNTVLQLIEQLARRWPGASWRVAADPDAAREAGLLKLNCDKALAMLDWVPTLDFENTVEFTADWYRAYYAQETDIATVTKDQIDRYCRQAIDANQSWAR